MTAAVAAAAIQCCVDYAASACAVLSHPIFNLTVRYCMLIMVHASADEIDSLVTLAGEATSANTFERRNVHMSAHFIAQQGLTITLQI